MKSDESTKEVMGEARAVSEIPLENFLTESMARFLGRQKLTNQSARCKE